MAKLVSKVYGDALFEAAMERDMLSPVYEEVQSLQTILMENADLVQFLNHPQIIKEEKLKVVENIFKGRVSDDLMQGRRRLCFKWTFDYGTGSDPDHLFYSGRYCLRIKSRNDQKQQ